MQVLVAIILLVINPVTAWSESGSGNVLSLQEYLQQVQSKNGTYRGSVELREASRQIGREADLIFSPSLFANVEAKSDEKQSYGSLYNKTESQTYSSGIIQTSSCGLQSKLYYSFDETKYSSVTGSNKYSDGSPVVEFSLPVWKNGFGRSDRAKEEATRAQSEQDSWNAENERKILLVNAEISYWKLAVMRELMDIQKSGVEASQAIYDYDMKQAEMNLTDKADVLQAKANLESKRLDLKAAEDNVGAAWRSLNAYRNSDEESPLVEKINWDRVKIISSVEMNTFEIRADVKAAEVQAKAMAANARIKEEDNKPSLNLYIDYAWNGGATQSSDAISDSFSSERPTTTAGFKFSVPLNMGATGDVRAGARKKADAAELAYQQKLRDQESDWHDLKEKLRNARERFEMTFSIESAQKEKLEYERDRLKRGRTTTYQVLQFEKDYLDAEYSRASAGYEILNLAAQMNLYRNNPAHWSIPKTGEKI
ncbi:MAG: TolC family protein [Candidatus Omnitrophota bacterium]